MLRQRSIWRIFYVALFVVSLVFIGYAIYTNWNQLSAQNWHLNYRYIALSILLFPLGMLPTVAAWHKLLDAIGVRKPFPVNLRIYALSSLPRHIPGLVWYVSSRTMMYQEESVPTGSVVAATGLEVVMLAITGFATAILLFLRGSVVLEQFRGLQFIIPIAVLLGLGLIFSTPIINKLSPRIFRRWNVEQIPTIQRGSLIICILWMFGAWMGGGLLLFLLVRGFIPVEWSTYPVMVGIWGIASAVGLTIGIGVSGMGLREVTLGALLSLVIPPLTAVVVAITFRLVLLVGEFMWVLLFAWITKSVPWRPLGRTKKMD
jgi:hypothetical protein